jgi:hypothetical protein
LEKIAVRFNSVKELKAICRKANKQDISTWTDAEIIGNTFCMYLDGGACRIHDREADCLRRGYKIITAEDYLKEGFKVGDRVECIEPKGLEAVFNLKKNKIYTIISVSSDAIRLQGEKMAYCIERFKLANNQTKTIKQEERMQINETIVKVCKEKKKSIGDLELLNKYFSSEITSQFKDELFLLDNIEYFISEAKKRQKAEDAAKKEA